MTTILTFCTADIPSETIDQFLRESKKAEFGQDCFLLARSPDQTVFKPAKPRIKPFRSGFIGADFDTLIKFIQELPEANEPDLLDREIFAILDSRSLEDQTVVIWTWAVGKPAIERKYDDDGIEDGHWKEFRTPWKWSAHVVGTLGFRPQTYTLELGLAGVTAHFDEKGVFQTPDALMKEWDLVSDEEDEED